MTTRLSLDDFWDTAPPGGGTFQADRLPNLPDAARRYFEHAIRPGARLALSVRLRMHGTIKLKRWMPFRAEQVIRWDRGMIWQASTRMSGLPIGGSDRFVDGVGSMRWRMLGLLPLITAAGPDITRSAAGRFMAESIWLPSALCRGGVTWTAPEPCRLLASFEVADEAAEIELTTDDSGRLQSVSLQRWGNPNGGAYGYSAFGAVVQDEAGFDGFTIPTRLRVGWRFGTDQFASEGEFFRVTIDDAAYR